jgi:hypothetical protein
LCLCRGGVRGNSNDRVASLAGIYTQHDHHGSQLLSLVRGVVRTGRWARLSAGLEVNLLSSHAGRSGAPNEWQNTQQATPLAGTAMENQPIRHHQHATEPLWAGVGSGQDDYHRKTEDQQVSDNHGDGLDSGTHSLSGGCSGERQERLP